MRRSRSLQSAVAIGPFHFGDWVGFSGPNRNPKEPERSTVNLQCCHAHGHAHRRAPVLAEHTTVLVRKVDCSSYGRSTASLKPNNSTEPTRNQNEHIRDQSNVRTQQMKRDVIKSHAQIPSTSTSTKSYNESKIQISRPKCA